MRFVSSLYVLSSSDEGEFRACPCTLCVLCLPCAFGHLVTGKVSGNHAPLLIKALKLSCLCSRPLLCTFDRLVKREGFRKPCTSPPHEIVWAFVNICSSFPCAFMRPMKREQFTSKCLMGVPKHLSSSRHSDFCVT